MKTQSVLFGTVALLAIAGAIGCGKDNNQSTADRAVADTAAANRTAPPSSTNDWILDRDAYVAKRQQDMDDLNRQWDTFQAKASAKSKRAWKELTNEAASMREDLDKAKSATKEEWDVVKQRLNNDWTRVQKRAHDVFGDDAPAPPAN